MVEVVATVMFEGLHQWPSAPRDVQFLREPHRHLFQIRCFSRVESDREIEFILLKREVAKYLAETYPNGDLGTRSCEALGKELLDRFGLSRCEVFEDGENGSVVSRD
jgi:hypothetical protein